MKKQLLFILLSFFVVLAYSQSKHYKIGAIPDQIAWVGDTLTFYVDSSAIGNNVNFAITPITGRNLSYNTNTKVFTYIASQQDYLLFYVNFKAFLPGDTVQQSVRITPMPLTAAEQSCFTINTGNLPDGSANNYILTTVQKNLPDTFNFVYQATRNITISAKDLTIEHGSPNNIYNTYNENHDIKNFTIHAENLIIKEKLHLPATNVTIYARHISFQDHDSTIASISTVPDTCPFFNTQLNSYQHNGLKGGNISMFVSDFKDSLYTDTSTVDRHVCQNELCNCAIDSSYNGSFVQSSLPPLSFDSTENHTLSCQIYLAASGGFFTNDSARLYINFNQLPAGLSYSVTSGISTNGAALIRPNARGVICISGTSHCKDTLINVLATQIVYRTITFFGTTHVIDTFRTLIPIHVVNEIGSLDQGGICAQCGKYRYSRLISNGGNGKMGTPGASGIAGASATNLYSGFTYGSQSITFPHPNNTTAMVSNASVAPYNGMGCPCFNIASDMSNGFTGNLINGGNSCFAGLPNGDYWPTNGTDATPGTNPGWYGLPGSITTNAASLVYNNNVFSPPVNGQTTFTTVFQAKIGQSGLIPFAAYGGSAGTPNPAYQEQYAYDPNNNCNVIHTQEYSHSSTSGNSWYPALNSAAQPVVPNQLVVVQGTSYSWLSPYISSQVLSYTHDLYLNGYLDSAASVCTEYSNLITSLSNDPAWATLSPQWQAMLLNDQNQFQYYLQQINSKLDYFGKPLGWAPMLSFAANYSAFKNEINSAATILWDIYYLRNTSDSLTNKIAVLSANKSNLIADEQAQSGNLNNLIAALSVLQQQLTDDSIAQSAFEAAVSQRQQQLTQLAVNMLTPPKKSFLQNTLTVVGTIAEICPFGQPIVGAIGAGVVAASNIDFSNDNTVSGLVSIGTQIGTAVNNGNGSAKTYAQNLGTFSNDLSNINLNGSIGSIIGQAGPLVKDAGPIIDKVESAYKSLTKTSVPESKVDALLQQLEAQDGTYTTLIDTLKTLLIQKETLARQVVDDINQVSYCTNKITSDVLTVDAINETLSQLNSVDNPRLTQCLGEIQKAQQDRMLLYLYTMKKSYEYTFVKPFPTTPAIFDLSYLYNQFVALNSTVHGELDSAQLNTCLLPYINLLSSLGSNILTQANNNANSNDSYVTYQLSQQELNELNTERPFTINFYNKGIFDPLEENLRINSIQIIKMAVDSNPVQNALTNHIDLYIDYNGTGIIRKNAEDYLFRFYSDETDAIIQWKGQKDLLLDSLSNATPSPNASGLLNLVLNNPSNNNLYLFAQPAINTDLIFTKNCINRANGSTTSNVNINLDTVILRLNYSYTPAPTTSQTLLISTNIDSLLPYYNLNQTDQNGRTDGRGAFYRTYTTSTNVSVNAPIAYGSYKFQKWTDENGNVLGGPTDTSIIVNMNSYENRIAWYSNLNVNFLHVNPNTCFNANNGSITAAGSGGNGVYSYLWSNGATSAVINGLAAGNYTLTVTSNSDSVVSTVTIAQVGGSPLLVTSGSSVSSCTVNDGKAFVNVSGGTPSYTYNWSNGDHIDTILNLAPGSYSVTVSDSNSCSVTAAVNVNGSSTSVLHFNATEVQCYGDSTGGIVSVVTGTAGPFTYLWSNGATSTSLNHILAGSYTLTVTDVNGCKNVQSIVITQPPSPLSLNLSATNTTCFSHSGSVVANVTGGNGNPAYLWNTNAVADNLSGLAAGIYSVTVTEAGCSASANTVVNNSNGAQLTILSSNPTCSYSHNGSATVIVNQAQGSYNIFWNNSAITPTIDSLTAGSYTVVVQDISSGCDAYGVVNVVAPQSLVITPEVGENLCSGNQNGSITISVSGGSSPYFYSWFDHSTQNSISNLSAGSYSITVSDSRQCTAVGSFNITQPSAITISISSQHISGGAAVASANVNGGTQPYYYNWSNGQTASRDTGLTSGTYDLTVTDANHCSSTAAVTVTGINELNSLVSLKIEPNPANDYVNVNIVSNVTQVLQIRLIDVTGKVIFTSPDFAVTDQISYPINTSNYPAGIYLVEISGNDLLASRRLVITK